MDRKPRRGGPHAIRASESKIRFALVAVAGFALAGCGPSEELGQVSGWVTYQGTPVTIGTVIFEDSARGISVRAPLDDDGRYHLRTYDRDGLPPGEYRVAVTVTRIGTGESPLVGSVDPAPDPVEFRVPEKYWHVKTSGLTATIEAGENIEDFEIE